MRKIVLKLALAICLLSLFSAAEALVVNDRFELNYYLQHQELVTDKVIELDPSVEYVHLGTGYKLNEGYTLKGNGAVVVLEYDNEGLSTASLFVNNSGTIENLTVQLAGAADFADDMPIINAGICNENTGSILNCRVKGEGTSKGYNTNINDFGGIATTNRGLIKDCKVSDCLFRTGWNYPIMGGIAAMNSGTISGCCVSGCVLKFLQPQYVGGIAGDLRGGTVTNCCVYNTTMMTRTNTPPQCGIGGIAGNAFSGTVSNCYSAISYDFAPGKQYGLWVAAFIGKREAECSVNNSYYCSDADLVFELPAVGDGSSEGIGAKTANQIKNNDFCQELGEGWYLGVDGWPVCGGLITCNLVRPGIGDDVLSKDIGELKCKYSGESSFNVAKSTVISPGDFELINNTTDGTELRLDYITLNGQKLTGPVTAGDYDWLNFSAHVTNITADGLRKEVNVFKPILTAPRAYTAESADALRTAVNNAEAYLAGNYLNVTKTQADEHIKAMETARGNLELRKITVEIKNSGLGGGYVSLQPFGSPISSFEGCLGDRVTLYAHAEEGSSFAGWYDDSGSIGIGGWKDIGSLLGAEETLEYTLTYNTVIWPNFSKLSHKFIFKDSLGKVYKVYNLDELPKSIPYPFTEGSTSMRTGYVLKKWTNDYTGTILVNPTSIRPVPLTVDVVFTAQLERDDDQKYTVEYTTDGETKSETLRAGKFFRTTARDTYNGNGFMYWQNTETGELLTYKPDLLIPVYSDMKLEAVYGAASSEIPTSINLQAPVINKDAGKLSFTGQVVPGDDFEEEIYHGMLLLKSSTDVSELDFNTSGVVNKISSGLSATAKAFIISVTDSLSGADSVTYYARAYVTYKSKNGGIATAFSGIRKGTWP